MPTRAARRAVSNRDHEATQEKRGVWMPTADRRLGWKYHVDRLVDTRHTETLGDCTMNILLWVLQVLTALLYGASGVMKVFMFEKVSADVPSFGALPREAWAALGILELVCMVGLVAPGVLNWHPRLTAVAATVLAIECLVFVWVHVQYRETAPLVFSAALGLLMAFIAYGRTTLAPIP
jgi:uncharacterized membrane protein YphA (DoxX/SURF4 family)